MNTKEESEKEKVIKNIVEFINEGGVNRILIHGISPISHYGTLFFSEEELSYKLEGTGYKLIELHALDELNNSDLIKEGQVNQILIDIEYLNNFIVKS